MKRVQPPVAEPVDDSTLRMRPAMRKRWLYILPTVFVTYSLAYLDRANYGFGAAAGLATTLHISKSRSALLGALFFLGYFLFQIPGASFARRSARNFSVFASSAARSFLRACFRLISLCSAFLKWF